MINVCLGRSRLAQAQAGTVSWKIYRFMESLCPAGRGPKKGKCHIWHLCWWESPVLHKYFSPWSSGEITQSISSTGIRGYWSRSYQLGPVLYYLRAGEQWEWCWWFLIWLYLEDNVNENWVLLLVQSKCRGRLRHLRMRREATFQEKSIAFY